MGGVKDVKLLGLEDSYIGRFRAPSRRFATTASTSMVVGEAPRYLLEAVAFGGMVLLVLGLLVQGNGQLSDILPTLGVFAFAGLRMFPALQQIYNSLTRMRFIGPMLDNVHRDMLQTYIAPAEPVDATAVAAEIARQAGAGRCALCLSRGRSCGAARADPGDCREYHGRHRRRHRGGQDHGGRPDPGVAGPGQGRTQGRWHPGHAAEPARLAGCAGLCAPADLSCR